MAENDCTTEEEMRYALKSGMWIVYARNWFFFTVGLLAFIFLGLIEWDALANNPASVTWFSTLSLVFWVGMCMIAMYVPFEGRKNMKEANEFTDRLAAENALK